MTTDAGRDARAELAALAAAGGAVADLPNLRGPADPVDTREAAVLVLFGTLDRVPSDRAAAAPAVSRDLDVLLLARADTLRAHPGQIAFPGGRLESTDDGPVAAALREAREETGLDPHGVEVLGALTPLPLAVSGHRVTPVLAWWARPSPVAVVDPGESSDVFRVPVAELLDPENRRSAVVRRDGREWRSPAFLVDSEGTERLVWGFTAIVLDGLFERLGWTEGWDRSRLLDLQPGSPSTVVAPERGPRDSR